MNDESNSKGILIFNQNLRDFKFLSDEQAGKAIKALAGYYLDGEDPGELGESITQMVFSHLKENADWALNKYEKVCERNRKATESRETNRAKKKTESTTIHQNHHVVNLVNSGDEEKSVVSSGDESSPNPPKKIKQNKNKEKEKRKVGRIENDQPTNSDSFSQPVILTDDELSNLIQECGQYLETDEEVMRMNLQILLKTYLPDEIKNAIKKSSGYDRGGNWDYITAVCRNTRKEIEMLSKLKRGLDPAS